MDCDAEEAVAIAPLMASERCSGGVYSNWSRVIKCRRMRFRNRGPRDVGLDDAARGS